MVIGRHPEFVQGGGGNISVKNSEGVMAIKASGVTLKAVTEDTGFSLLTYKPIVDFLQTDNLTEASSNAFVHDQLIEWNGEKKRPSMETGFHAVLDDYVVHTHSIYTNILCCAKEGQRLMSVLFPDAVWIPFCTPGLDLSKRIQAAVAQDERPSLFFLENHGIIVHGDSMNFVIDEHKRVNNVVKEHFGLTAALADITDIKPLAFMASHVLFPDQIVYTRSEELRITTAGQETLAAYTFIHNEIEECCLTPSYVEEEAAQIIENLDAEAYRKKLAN